MGDRRSTKIAKMMVLCWNLLPHAFVWAIYIYIESIEVTCRLTVVKIVLIGNLRWLSSCLYLLYFPATVLFTCIKSWFFRNHLANFHQISHWSYCWNVIDSLFKWLCSIDCHAHIFFFKTKNCSNDDLFIGCDDRMGKMLHNICISAVVMSLRWASRGPWASCYYFSTKPMLWVLIRSVSSSCFRWVPATYVFMEKLEKNYVATPYLEQWWMKNKSSPSLFNYSIYSYTELLAILILISLRLVIRRSPVWSPLGSATFFFVDWSWNIFYDHFIPSVDSRRALSGKRMCRSTD